MLAKYRRDRNGSKVSPTLEQPTGSRRVKRVAVTILVLIPVAVAAWMASIVVPTAYEAWQASEDIFQPRANRQSLANQAPAAPTAMPQSVADLMTATAGGTPPASLATQIPIGVPPDNPPTATLGTVTHPDVVGRAPTRTESVADGTQPTATATTVPLPDWNGSDPIHVLLLGVDTRPSETTEGRSDTMIVVRIEPTIRRVDMFSIPRDLVVNIPGFSDGVKVNSAYPWGEWYDVEGGGPALVAQTIEFNFGIAIDYYATVDIPGLEQIVDTLGGVVVNVEAQLKDDQYPTEDYGYTRAYFPSGLQTLNGTEAVQFARTRHADGDFQRAQRQQLLLMAIRTKVLESGLITKLPDLIGDLRDTVRTDLSPRQVLSLASLSQEIEPEDIWLHSLAPYTYANSTEAGWFLFGDWEALRWLTQNLDEDPLATNLPGN